MNTYKVKNLRLTACCLLYSLKDDILQMSGQPSIFKVQGTLKIWEIAVVHAVPGTLCARCTNAYKDMRRRLFGTRTTCLL